MHILSLNDELLILIFAQMDNYKDIHNCRQCCRRFKSIIDANRRYFVRIKVLKFDLSFEKSTNQYTIDIIYRNGKLRQHIDGDNLKKVLSIWLSQINFLSSNSVMRFFDINFTDYICQIFIAEMIRPIARQQCHSPLSIEFDNVDMHSVSASEFYNFIRLFIADLRRLELNIKIGNNYELLSADRLIENHLYHIDLTLNVISETSNNDEYNQPKGDAILIDFIGRNPHRTLSHCVLCGFSINTSTMIDFVSQLRDYPAPSFDLLLTIRTANNDNHQSLSLDSFVDKVHDGAHNLITFFRFLNDRGNPKLIFRDKSNQLDEIRIYVTEASDMQSEMWHIRYNQ